MDRVFYNGRILTMRFKSAVEEEQHRPEAVLVRDGVIAALGSLDEIRKAAGPDADFLDLDGKCLMPGFIDPHSHFIMNGQTSMWADLSDCNSFAEIIDVLKDFRKLAGDPEAVIGFGYDHNFLKEGRHPDKRVLDQVSTEIPVFVIHVSVHFACGNSAVLKLAGIDGNTPDPEGGRYGRLAGSREPDGYLEETAMNPVFERFSRTSADLTPEQIAKMQETYLRFGVTTAQDGATSPEEMAALHRLAQADALKMDVVAYPMMSDHGEETLRRYRTYADGYRNHVKIGGYKLILDGSPQGRSAWMSEPYLGGAPDYCAYPWMTDGQVERFLETALREKRQVLAHCNGDAASEQFITAYEKTVAKSGIKEDLRPVMIHCQMIRNDQLDRMKKLNMIASIFVGHVWYWGDIHLMNFGPVRGNRISPVRDALKRGLHVNFHQDTPVTRPDVMHSVWCAVNRISRRGRVIGEEQKISVYEALRAVTAEGAYEYFEEDSKGTIDVGKRADLVVLERSPLDAPPAEIRNIKVVQTIKDGETVYERS